MSFVHVTQGNNGLYSAVIHSTTPSGTNLVGVTWKTCLLNSGARVSVLPVGTGMGQITSSESAQIVSGDLMEYQFGIQANADGSTPSSAEITERANAEVARQNVNLLVMFKYFGYTQ